MDVSSLIVLWATQKMRTFLYWFGKKKIVQVLEQVAETSLDAFFFFFSRPLRPKYFSGIISQYGASESLMAIHIPFIFQLPRSFGQYLWNATSTQAPTLPTPSWGQIGPSWTQLMTIYFFLFLLMMLWTIKGVCN